MISILCPTRARTESVLALIASAAETACHPEALEFVFYIDHDDPQRLQTIELVDAERDDGTGPDVTVLVGTRTDGNLSEMWNACARVASHDILMHCGDDIRFRTKDWDLEVVDAFAEYPDHIVFVHGYDGHQPDSFGTHGFIHRLWMDTVGYFVPPYFTCDWNDTWLNDVANMIGRRHFVHILTEHLHPVWHTRPLDETDRARMARGHAQGADQLYLDKLPERHRDADLLRQIIARWAITDGALSTPTPGGNGG